jgi:hypothetical protein
MATEQQAREVKRRYAAQMLRRPGVCGFGVEKDEQDNYVLALHLDTDDEAVQSQLPKELEGIPVKIIRSGPFHKQA